MITSRGIEVNPDKYKAIQQMKNPSNVKEVQRVTGRIATFWRYGDTVLQVFKEERSV